MAITVAQLHGHLEAARAALSDANPSEALRQAQCALATLSGLPDSELQNDRVHWRSTIDGLIVECRRAVGEAAVVSGEIIRRTKITRARPST